MINSKYIKEQLNDNDIIKILELLGCSFIKNENDYLICETICHHGDSHKLYYYKNTKMFYCYTHCGSIDIFGLIQNSLNIDFYDSIMWILNRFNINSNICNNRISDWNFIKNYKKSKTNTLKQPIKTYNDNIFNIFQKKYYLGWINEGISIDSMIKYNIMYCDYNQQIIIPHYNSNNELIGIRARNLNPDIDIKYIPFYDGNILYNHSLSTNLYGLNQNKECIKRKRKVMIVESEKSVMQCDTMFQNDNFSVAICGSNISIQQIKLLLDLNVNEIILALDRQFKELGDLESINWKNHIMKIAQKILPYVKVSILWDDYNLLNYKDSPTDKGKETLLKLLDNKMIYFPT